MRSDNPLLKANMAGAGIRPTYNKYSGLYVLFSDWIVVMNPLFIVLLRLRGLELA